VEQVSIETARALVQLVAPFAPHFGEELWERLGGHPSVAAAGWPAFDPAKLERQEVTLIVQVNGKHRGEVTLPKTAGQTEAEAAARSDPKIGPHLDGKAAKKVVYVPGRILNFVVG
jgi:leucyl-tRNA synthetase